MLACILLLCIVTLCCAAPNTKKDGEERVKGVSPVFEEYYSPAKNKKGFECFDGSKVVPWTSVNNGLCECGDCSDEPGSGLFKGLYYYCKEDVGAISHMGSASDGCLCCDCEDNTGIILDDAQERCGQSRISTFKSWQAGVERKRAETKAFYEASYGRELTKDDIEKVKKAQAKAKKQEEQWQVLSKVEPVHISTGSGIDITLDLARQTLTDHAQDNKEHKLTLKGYSLGSKDDPTNALLFGGKTLNPKVNDVSDVIPVLQSAEFDGGRVVFECGPEPLQQYWAGRVRGELVVVAQSIYACDARAVGLAYLTELARNGKSFRQNVIEKGQRPKE